MTRFFKFLSIKMTQFITVNDTVCKFLSIKHKIYKL